MAWLIVGCGGRSALFGGAGGDRDGGSGGTIVEPQGTGGQGGRADAKAEDVSVKPDIVVIFGSDAAAEDPRDVHPDSDADARPDFATDPAIVPEAGRLDAGPGDRFDTTPDIALDGPIDSHRDTLADGKLDMFADSNRDVQADANRDAQADANREVGGDGPGVARDAGLDLSWEASPGDSVEIGGTIDASGPGLRVLAGVLAGPGALDGIGPAAQFYFPAGVASDGAGTLYVADAANNTIRKIVLATREVTTLAGAVGVTGSDDGIGTNARFYSPQGLAMDGAGNLYIADSVNSTIRKLVIATGEVTTFAGSAGLLGGDDGRGGTARFGSPMGLAYDGVGNLFVADINGAIRKVVLATRDVTTLAGDMLAEGSQDGTGQAALFRRPEGIASDKAGNLYVADTYNHTIRKIVAATGVVTTLAGTPGSEGTDDGVAAAARFSYPHGVAVDAEGTLVVADFGSSRIRKVVLATATVTTLAGRDNGNSDGTGAYARFDGPDSLAYDGAGNLLVTDSGNHTLRQVVLATADVTTVAGRSSSAGSVDGVGAAARFYAPQGLASDGTGNLLVADSSNNTIRKVAVATGAVTTLAGMAGGQGSLDGAGTAALFNFPVALVYDAAGAVYVADQQNSTIRKLVLATGAVTTVAGLAGRTGYDDGIGAAARFGIPAALALDGVGNLFVADQTAHTIRKIVLASATVMTLAGAAGTAGSDDGIGTGAHFNGPSGLACDGAGNLFVADSGNYTIRKIVIATAVTTTLAGSPGVLGTDDGSAMTARFMSPRALAMDTAGNLFVADAEDDAVRKVNTTTGLVTTVVGHAGRWETVPGPLPACLATPGGVAVLPSGDLAITDSYENAILVARF